jgi:hypothetical protein
MVMGIIFVDVGREHMLKLGSRVRWVRSGLVEQ